MKIFLRSYKSSPVLIFSVLVNFLSSTSLGSTQISWMEKYDSRSYVIRREERALLVSSSKAQYQIKQSEKCKDSNFKAAEALWSDLNQELTNPQSIYELKNFTPRKVSSTPGDQTLNKEGSYKFSNQKKILSEASKKSKGWADVEVIHVRASGKQRTFLRNSPLGSRLMNFPYQFEQLAKVHSFFCDSKKVSVSR